MNIRSYFSDLSAVSKLAVALGLSNVLLALAVFVFVVSYSSRDVVTRIIPVGMTAEAEIASKSANVEYKRAIALFIATMTGSLQPQTAPSVVDELSTFFDPQVYRDYREFALSVINDPVLRQANVASAFHPTSVMYEQTTDRVFVMGTQVLRGAGINRQTPMVYEMSIGIARGRPLVTYIKSYQGALPETLKILLSRHKDVERLPNEVRPLDMRPFTPDERAGQLIEERGDIDVQPQASQQLLQQDSR